MGIDMAEHSTLYRVGAVFSLSSFEDFLKHPWIKSVSDEYEKDSALATAAKYRLVLDLEQLNENYFNENKRVAFTTIEGRVKEKDSLLKKLYKICCNESSSGMNKDIIMQKYKSIKDICGVRFSCPYYDEVVPSIVGLVRPALKNLGYGVDLTSDGYKDKNYLDIGDEHGYRSYHFYVTIPTQVDIYGETEMCLCEIQARTELQHIWAVKSHDLLYKPEEGWVYSDEHVIEDMKQISNSLRVADQFLMSVRDRARGK